MADDVVVNMVAGYTLVDTLAGAQIDLFALGNLKYLLELNTTVLCGTSAERRAEYTRHRTTTEQRFYEDTQGGIRDVVEWYRRNDRASAWMLAAGLYIRILSKPQLFIEGNHRTGALVMSYVLIGHGEPPFVLTPANAVAYFDPSTTIRDTRRRGVTALVRVPRATRRLAAFLAAQADRRYLRAEGTIARPEPDAAEKV